MKAIDKSLLQRVIRSLVSAINPEKIFLFGSHAYGVPHGDSDVDLLIVVRESKLPSYKRAVNAYRALRGLFFPAEIKVVTEEEFERRSKYMNSIERVITEKGKLLYDVDVEGS